MLKLNQCENPSGNPNIKILDVNGWYSYGDFQYQMPTWLRYSKTMGTTKENINDPILQWAVTRHILDTKGSGDWWNCSKKVEKLLGPYPV